MATAPDDKDTLGRISALTSNARSTWFALLAALIFVGVTLMSAQHIDFYGADRNTVLPVVNFPVPTRLFFVAAPILIAAVYGYFHLYLLRIWDALGAAPAEVNGRPLGDVVSPWLVIDAALHRRNRLRTDHCITPRALEGASMVLNLCLAWGFGPLILALLWWQSMTARSLVMTLLAGLALLVALRVGAASWVVMQRRMAGLTHRHPLERWQIGADILASVTLLGLVALFSVERTVGWLSLRDPVQRLEATLRGLAPDDPEHSWVSDILGLAPINLARQSIVERPTDWLPHDIARTEFLVRWCAREAPACDKMQQARIAGVPFTPPRAFEQEWQNRRLQYLRNLAQPEFNPIDAELLAVTGFEEPKSWFRRAPDLSQAMLGGAHMPGINLLLADLSGAHLGFAELEKADLTAARLPGVQANYARLQGSYLSLADLRGADLRGASLQDAYLIDADLTRATLVDANLSRADLGLARLERADLNGATLIDAYLREADLTGARLAEANLLRANLVLTNFEEANLTGAVLQEADLTESRLTRAGLHEAQLQRAILTEATLREAELRDANLDDAKLFAADLTYARLDEAQLNRADLRSSEMAFAALDKAQMLKADMSGANLQDAYLTESDLTEATLERADLARATLTGTTLANADMRRMKAPLARFGGANLSNADLTGADLQDAGFVRARMREADLSLTHLARTRFGWADLQGAVFDFSLFTARTDLHRSARSQALRETNLVGSRNQGGALRGLDMSQAVFDAQTDFRNAFLDASVTLPLGFEHR